MLECCHSRVELSCKVPLKKHLLPEQIETIADQWTQIFVDKYLWTIHECKCSVHNCVLRIPMTVSRTVLNGDNYSSYIPIVMRI